MFLMNTKKLLGPGGKIFLKEQYSEDQDTYYSPRHKDWIRSIDCFVAAFKETQLSGAIVNKYEFGQFNKVLTWILSPSDNP